MLEGVMWELLKAVHNQAQINLCTSTAMQEALTSHGIERVEVWQKGVDTELFDPSLTSQTVRSHLSQGHPDSPLLLYVGRLSAEKEIDRIKPVMEAIPGARLALVGDGPYRAELEKHFEGTPTHFVGYLTGKDLAAAFASADAFVFPSRTETLGLVLLEAMCLGVPVVSTAVMGTCDILAARQGALVAEEDVAQFAAQVRRVLDDAELRQRLSAEGRIYARQWAAAGPAQALLQFYQDVQGERGSESA
jgi:glycosyltransferase involved in cell wall biosynthesis